MTNNKLMFAIMGNTGKVTEAIILLNQSHKEATLENIAKVAGLTPRQASAALRTVRKIGTVYFRKTGKKPADTVHGIRHDGVGLALINSVMAYHANVAVLNIVEEALEE